MALKIKAVNCGKEGCTKCPHAHYVYLQWREGKKVREKYLGKLGATETQGRIDELMQENPSVRDEWAQILETFTGEGEPEKVPLTIDQKVNLILDELDEVMTLNWNMADIYKRAIKKALLKIESEN